MVVLSKHPIADRRRAHLPALPLEGHARRAAARRPDHGRARRLVLTRGARGVPPVEQVALGRARSTSAAQTVHVLASHPTPPTFDGAEDRNGRRNHDEIRFWADYVSPGRGPRTSTTTPAARGGLQPERVLRHPRRPERRPARRRLRGRRDRPAARPPAHHRPAADVGGRRRGRRAAGRRERDPPGRPGLRHGRLQRQPRAGQPAGRLRAAVARPSRARTPASSGPCRPTRCRRSPGRFPFPSSDHRLVWVDLRVHGCTPGPVSSAHSRSPASGRRGWPATG